MRFYQEITPTAFSVVGFVFLRISHSLLAQAFGVRGGESDFFAGTPIRVRSSIRG
jgi:hypothetical protein